MIQFFSKNLGLWTSSWFLGAFVGPTLGGILVEKLGFAHGAQIYGIFFLFTTFLDLGGVACLKMSTKTIDGYELVK